MDDVVRPERGLRVEAVAARGSGPALDAVLDIVLDAVLAATSAVAGHIHLFDRERAVFGATVERGQDLGARALLRAVGRDATYLNAIMLTCQPRVLEPAPIADILAAAGTGRRADEPGGGPAPTAGWEVAAVLCRLHRSSGARMA